MKICSICGRVATNEHHLRQKGMGGLGKKSKPEQHETVTLCGSGTTGCHGYVHSHDISVQKINGELYYMLKTDKPMDYLKHLETSVRQLELARFYGVHYEDLM